MRGKYCFCGNEKIPSEESCEECKKIEERNKANSTRRMYPNKIEKQPIKRFECLRGKANAPIWV